LKKQSNKSVRQQPFYSIAEVYNYNISAGKSFDFEIRKWIISKMALTAWSILNSNMTPKRLWIYILYSAILNGELKGNSVLNYLSSWWRWSFDAKRTKTIEAGTKLLLSPNCSGILWWWKRL
jgi:alpha-amylase